MTTPHCSVLDLIDDQGIEGWRATVDPLKAILAASAIIEAQAQFFPRTETRSFDASQRRTQWIDPLLSLTSLTFNDEVLDSADYHLLPYNRHWPNGPQTSIEMVDRAYWSSSDRKAISIAGRWGLYDDHVALGAGNLVQTNSATQLTVENASLISPGTVLLLDSELEVVQRYAAPVATNCVLDAALDASAALFAVQSGELLNQGEIIRVNAEQ